MTFFGTILGKIIDKIDHIRNFSKHSRISIFNEGESNFYIGEQRILYFQTDVLKTYTKYIVSVFCSKEQPKIHTSSDSPQFLPIYM